MDSRVTLPWLVITGVAISLFYLVSEAVTPFFVAFVLAYILYPVTKYTMHRFKISQQAAAFIIFMVFLGFCISLITMIVPLIYNQITELVVQLPKYRVRIEDQIDLLSARLDALDPEISSKISAYLQTASNSILNILSSFANHIWDYTLATINFFTIAVIVPFALFYFLRDWHKITDSIASLLPLDKKSQMQNVVMSINHLLSDYIRGQLTICLFLSLYYMLGLTLININFALILGICSGFLVLIPIIGSIIAYILVLLSCYVSQGFGVEIGYATILFIIAHILEGYYLTPKIIGNKIGLHPVWVVFAVLVAANLYGIVGIIFALPVAGIIKILWLHLIDYYKSSSMYSGITDEKY